MSQQYKVGISQQAEQSMNEIANYIAFQLMEPKIASNWIRLINDKIQKLNFMPERIQLTPESPWHETGIHRMSVKNFYVYFWINEEHRKVQIIDVTYSKRDQVKLLETMPLDDER